jgi:hypothetical protein
MRNHAKVLISPTYDKMEQAKLYHNKLITSISKPIEIQDKPSAPDSTITGTIPKKKSLLSMYHAYFVTLFEYF